MAPKDLGECTGTPTDSLPFSRCRAISIDPFLSDPLHT